MNKDDHYYLGSLLKTIGNKGEIILKFSSDCPQEIIKLGSIFINVDNKLVPFFIEHIRIKPKGTAVVKIEDLNSEEKTSEFIGCKFYISKEQVKTIDLVAFDNPDVKGYIVKNQNMKFIGEVIEFIDISDNPLLNIKTERGEVLIPANDKLIIKVDDDLKVIQLIIPKGLLEID